MSPLKTGVVFVLLGLCAAIAGLAGCTEELDATYRTQSHAATLTVPGQYPTIQAAIDAAAAGDTVQVAPGDYYEQLEIDSKAVKVIGSATQRPRLFGNVYFFHADGAELKNFAIYRTIPDRVWAVRAYTSSVHLDRVDASGFGQAAFELAGATAQPSLVTRSVLSGNGDGISVEQGASAVLAGNVIVFNDDNGISVTSSSIADVFNNTVVGNGNYNETDPGIFCQGPCSVFNNIMVSNSTGLACSSGACSDADYNLVWGNVTNYGANATAGLHDLSTDPLFVDFAESDFHLAEGSSAIDAGSDQVITVDFDGVPRPQGAGFDLGAYEYARFTSATTLVITEVMANPLNESTDEFVELYNYGDQPVDAAGLIIYDGDATDALTGFQGGSTIIPAGGYAVIVDPDYVGGYTIAAAARKLTVASTTTIGNGLSTSDPISLWESDGIANLDRFSFPFDPGNGVSVEKVSVEEGDLLGNWNASPCGASPGLENCTSKPSNVSRQVLIAINEVMSNPLSESTGEFIEFYNFGAVAVDMANTIISDGDMTDVVVGWMGGTTVLQPGEYAVLLDPDYASEYTIPGATILLTVASSATIGNGLAAADPISLLEPTGQSVIDSYSRPYDPGNGFSIEKVDATIGDVPANWATSTCASSSSPGAANCAAGTGLPPVSGNTIAITEIMANPIDEDTGEYVELFNYGASSIDVAGWRLSDGDAIDTLIGYQGGTTIIPSGGYALILDQEYASDYSLPSGVILLTTNDTSVGSGLSTTDPVTLKAATGAAVVDAFSFPFNPGNGISVEKIDLVVGDVNPNWIASPCNRSPGSVNCAMTGSNTANIATTHVVISEVMANPTDEATGEFVELFNASPVAVDLAGFVLSDGDSIDLLAGFQGGPTVLQPGDYAVILDSGYAAQYAIESSALLLTAGTTLGNGLSTNDPITLYEVDGATIVDTFSFPTNPGDGISIEKRTLTSGDVPLNWAASTCRTGSGAANNYASPGWRNCTDPNSGFTGTNVTGEACPYGAVDCLSGLCVIDLFTFATYCSEDCSSSACPSGYACSSLEDIWGTGYALVCEMN